MTPDIKPVMFLYLSGAIDILITTVVIYIGWGYEVNPVYTWIQPTWAMLLSMGLANLLMCLLTLIAVMIAADYQSKYIQVMRKGFDWVLYGCGLSRLVVGAGSGVVIIAGVLL
jgi:cytochrome b subunit of formate dehydrogenase